MPTGVGARVALPPRARARAFQPAAAPAAAMRPSQAARSPAPTPAAAATAPDHHIRNIVVCGGSYGGMHCASHLAEHLPPGYRVILIERNSHFNHLYCFPRFSVLPGHEHEAYIPYTSIYASEIPPDEPAPAARPASQQAAASLPGQRLRPGAQGGKTLSEGPSSGGAATFDVPPPSTHKETKVASMSSPSDRSMGAPTSDTGSLLSGRSTVQTSVAEDGSDDAIHRKISDLDLHDFEDAVGEGGMEQLIELDAEHLRGRAPFQVADLHDISEHRGAHLEEDLTAEYDEDDVNETDSAPSSQAHHPHLVLQASVEKITASHVLVSPQSVHGNEPALSQLGHGGASSGLWAIDQVSIPYDYLVYALGSKMPDPLRSSARTKDEGVDWMKRMQKRIVAANSIVIVGGGALGVQYALDIATVYPDKAPNVTLLHSRQQLLPNFSPSVHDKVYAYLKQVGVNVVLGERLALSGGCPMGSTVSSSTGARMNKIDSSLSPTDQPVDEIKHIRTTSGRELQADLLLLCTGQQPNSGLLASFSPSSVDPNSRLVKVSRTLQVCASDPEGIAAHGPFEFTPPCGDCDCFAERKTGGEHPHLTSDRSASRHNLDEVAESRVLSRVYAIGDVADAFGAINAGYQAWSMAEVAARNIVRQIRVQEDSKLHANDALKRAAEEEALEHFTVQPAMLKLSLGLGQMVFQGLPGDDGKPVVEVREDPEDMQVKSVWRFMAKASTHNMHR